MCGPRTSRLFWPSLWLLAHDGSILCYAQADDAVGLRTDDHGEAIHTGTTCPARARFTSRRNDARGKQGRWRVPMHGVPGGGHYILGHHGLGQNERGEGGTPRWLLPEMRGAVTGEPRPERQEQTAATTRCIWRAPLRRPPRRLVLRSSCRALAGEPASMWPRCRASRERPPLKQRRVPRAACHRIPQTRCRSWPASAGS